MSANPLRDSFHYCWPVILNEARSSNDLFFEENNISITDSRDVDFDKIENRLAYMNKYGHINVALVEKCAADFLEQYFVGNKIFFPKSMKICSLSNGPGIDIIGFLRALYRTEQPECNPSLQAINFNGSWQDSYLNLSSSVYRSYISKFPETCTFLQQNIQFMQCDVFSNLSADAQELISACDVLLMVKVFYSSRATPQVFAETMQKIFSLLKPGALIFFFGSKKNIKDITTNDDAKKYVKCVFGPAKIDLEKLSAYEIISQVPSLKQSFYGEVHFFVLQKNISEVKDENISKILSKSQKKRIRQKRKNKEKKKNAAIAENSNLLSVTETSITDSEEESDTNSENSYTSSSVQSDALSIQSQHVSCENKFQSMAFQNVSNTDCTNKKEQSLNLSIKSVSPAENTFPFEKISDGSVTSTSKEESMTNKSFAGESTLNRFIEKFLQSRDVPQINLNSYREQSSPLDEPSKMQSSNNALSFQNLKGINSMNETKQSINSPTQSVSPSVNVLPFPKINTEIAGHMANTSAVSKESFVEGSALNQLQVFEKLRSSKVVPELITYRDLSIQDEGTKMHSTYDSFSFPSNMVSKVEHQGMETIPSGQIFPSNSLPQEDLLQSPNMTAGKDTKMKGVNNGRDKLMETSREKNCSSSMNHGSYSEEGKNIKSSISLKQASQKQCKLTNKSGFSEPDVGATDKNDLHLMLQRCETLVASLERTVAGIMTDVQALQQEVSMRECCSGYVCSTVRNLHCNIHHCNFPRQSCCRKMNDCIRPQCKFGVTYSNSVCCAEHITDTHACHRETNPKPYLVIPVQKENLLPILSFISK